MSAWNALFCTVTVAVVVGQDLDDLKRKLRDRDADLRRTAVQELALAGGSESWSLVLDSLSDPEPMVADQAQIELGTMKDAALLEELALGKDGLKSRDEYVRFRVAEALGQIEIPVPGSALAKALDDKSALVRRQVARTTALLAAAGRLAGEDAGLSQALQRCFEKDQDAEVRAAALEGLAALDPPERAHWAERGLVDDEPAVRAGALLVAAGLEPGPALDLAIRGSRDADWSVRRHAALLLGRIPLRGGALALVDALEKESELRLSWCIAERLQAVSGLQHRIDPRPWRQWAESLAEDWKPALAQPAHKDTESTVAFAGLPLLTKRVAFLIDLSGSMSESAGAQGTRKDVVAAELDRALSALSPETQFNVVPYANQPVPWEKELQTAKPAAVKKAAQFFRDCHATGKGNLWDAVLLALEDPAVDTLVVLSDGAPSGGRHWSFTLFGRIFPERLRYRSIALDFVLVQPSGRAVSCWSKLSAETGGRCVETELW